MRILPFGSDISETDSLAVTDTQRYFNLFHNYEVSRGSSTPEAPTLLLHLACVVYFGKFLPIASHVTPIHPGATSTASVEVSCYTWYRKLWHIPLLMLDVASRRSSRCRRLTHPFRHSKVLPVGPGRADGPSSCVRGLCGGSG